MGDSDKVTTSAADIDQSELEIALTTMEGFTTSAISTGGESSQLEGLQVSGESALPLSRILLPASLT